MPEYCVSGRITLTLPSVVRIIAVDPEDAEQKALEYAQRCGEVDANNLLVTSDE